MPVERNGMGNLRGYLQEAPLPWMPIHYDAPALPAEGHKSHQNHLQVQPEEWRRLETITLRPGAVGDPPTLEWIGTFIPGERLPIPDADRATGESLTVPCSPYFEIQSSASFPAPHNVQRMEAWIHGYPLVTTQRILHAVFPETEGWEFDLDEPKELYDEDWSERFRYYKWTYKGSSKTIRENHAFRSVIVAFQPPWILSDADIKEFCSGGDFPPYVTQETLFRSQLESKHRLWAKLWDTCARHKTAHFVLTNYHCWTGGAFTDGWTGAYVDEPLFHNSIGPSVLQMLIHTVASAMGLRGTQKRPMVPEPVKDLISGLIYIDIPDPTPSLSTFPRPPDSESHWDGKSVGPGTSAGVASEVSAANTSNFGRASQDERSARLSLSTLDRSAVQWWLMGTAAANRSTRHSSFENRSSRSSAVSQGEDTPFRTRQRRLLHPTLPTIEDVTDRDAMAGDWMG